MDQKLLKILEEELDNSIYPSEPAELYEPIRYIMSLGGKRVRPVVCMMAAELFGLDPASKSVVKVAKSLEIFHNFSLVHDDIMDEAPLRRGRATVHHKWNRDVAILSGDVMLVLAYQELLEAESDRLPQLLAQFNRSAILVCEGQQYDMNFEQTDEVSLSDYLKMIQLKTAELLACSLKLGALVANADEDDADALYDFGINLGLAFQIQDDYLDAFSDSDKFGKQKGGDILANKKTYLLLKAYELSSDEQRQSLNAAMNENGDKKVEMVLECFKSIGVDEEAKTTMDDIYQKALTDLDRVNVEAKKKEALKSIAASLMMRDH